MTNSFNFLTQASVLNLSPKASVQTLGESEGGVVLRTDTGEMFTVNDTTLEYLIRLDGKRPLSAIATSLTEVFDVGVEALIVDLIEISVPLIEQGLVVVSE